MTACRTVAQVREAAIRDAANDPPMSQETADHVAAILATRIPAARAA